MNKNSAMKGLSYRYIIQCGYISKTLFLEKIISFHLHKWCRKDKSIGTERDWWCSGVRGREMDNDCIVAMGFVLVDVDA